MKKVGIILINYKEYARKYLDACRDSLRKQNYDNFQVYLVDNASSAESESYLKESFSEAKIITRQDGNYCAANNAGMKQAIIDGCDYLVALNMDTELDIDWLSELVLALENNQEAGIAQSLILLHSPNKADLTNPLINTTGNLIHFLFFGFTNNYQKKESSVVINNYSEIQYASGCSFIIRKEVYNLIGAYDEDYYMYHDDLDLSLKTRLSGYRIILAAKSRLFHKYEFERSVAMLYYMERNRIMSFFIFYPFKLIIILLPLLIIMSLGMTIFAVKGSWLSTKLKVDYYFLKQSSWKKILAKRRFVKSISKVKFENAIDNFKGKIEFQEIDNPILKYLVNPIFNGYWQIIKKII